MSAQSKSGLFETPTSKASPATLSSTTNSRVSKSSRGTTKSQLDSLSKPRRLSVEPSHSPKSVNSVQSKPAFDRRTSRPATPPEKQQTRGLKGSELQAQLNLAQEDLKKAKEQLVEVEKEKAQAVNELKEARKLADEANEKLQDALVFRKPVEEDSEVEKFQAVETKKVGIDAAQKKEEDWKKEVEAAKKQHALDMAALHSTNQELQKVKQELAMTCDAKDGAFTQAEHATKMAEIHAEKVEILSAELIRFKAALDTKLKTEASENSEKVLKLDSDINSLKQELKNALVYKEKLVEREALIEQLNVDLEAARMAESNEHKLVDELRQRVQNSENQIKEANQMKRSVSESLDLLKSELQSKNDLLQVADAEISSLRATVGLLELSAGRHRGDIEELERCLNVSKRESSEMSKLVQSLKSELEIVKDGEAQALNNENHAVSNLHSLLEEKDKLVNELENSRAEEEKSKLAMDSLASAVQEASSKAREINEKLISTQNKCDSYEARIEDMKLVLKAANEKFQELENSRVEEEKSKKSMESLASAMREVSKEASETKEKLISTQNKCDSYEAKMEGMKLVLKETNEKYEIMLNDAKRDIDLLNSAIKHTEHEFLNSKAEWVQKELNLANCIKKSEEEKSKVESEVNKLVNMFQEAQAEASTAKEEGAQLRASVREMHSELIHLGEIDRKTNAKILKLKEGLLNKENELQTMVQKNRELRTKEACSLEKVEELSKLLEEAMTKNQSKENGELTDSEKEYDLLPKVIEFSEQNGHGTIEKLPPKLEVLSQENKELKTKNPEEENGPGPVKKEPVQEYTAKSASVAGNPVEEKESMQKEDNSVKSGDCKMWESCKIEGEKDFSPRREEPEKESLEGDLDSKVDASESFDQINGLSSSAPSKKKNALLKRFGNLLKKKGISNQNQL